MYRPDHEVTLERLTAAHADAILAFELQNREYFAAWVLDRGDDFFTSFPARHQALLDEQEAGTCRFHVLVDASGAVVGRVNLMDLEDGSAELGYRIAETATGHGLASAAVRAVAALAASEYGLTTLRAGTSDRNVASRAVLTRAGFRRVADPAARLGFELRLGES